MKKIVNKKLIVSLLLSPSIVFASTECVDNEGLEKIESKIYGASGAVDEPKSFDSYASGTQTRTEAISSLFSEYKSCLKKKEEEEATNNFIGLNWGVGLALTNINGSSIDEAKIIDGVVRVTKEHSSATALMLETHYFSKKVTEKGTVFGHGPFAAIRVADTENGDVGAFGFGYMIGFKDSVTESSSWNIGAGYFTDTEVKELGSGLSEGAALPGTETEIRYKEVDKSGWIIMLSSTF